MIEIELSLPRSRRSTPGAQKGILPGDVVRLTIVMFLWALCFPLIATGLAAAPPLSFAALRSFVAGAGLLLPAFVLRRPRPQGWRVWLSLLGVGLSATSLGFAGMFLAGGVVSPGLATVLANAQPLIAAGLAYVVLGERLGLRRRVGLSLGFCNYIRNAGHSPAGRHGDEAEVLELLGSSTAYVERTHLTSRLLAVAWFARLWATPKLLRYTEPRLSGRTSITTCDSRSRHYAGKSSMTRYAPGCHERLPWLPV